MPSNNISVRQDEIEGMIARLERRRDLCRDVPGYERQLTIEIIALNLLREMVALVDGNEEERPDVRAQVE